jgi:hypothetical protein
VERWKAREKVRSAIGWVAVINALGGLFALVAGVLVIARALGLAWTSTSVRLFGYDSPPGLELAWGVLIVCLGAALLYCAKGLWDVRTWARWVTVVLWGAICAEDVAAIVSGHSFSCGLPFALFATIYLLLPSTGKHFARASGVA